MARQFDAAEVAWAGIDSGGGAPKGIDPGIPALREAIGSEKWGQVSLLGADPRMGKTSWSLQRVLANAQAGIPCALFSNEMTNDQVGLKCVSMTTGLSTRQIEDGRLTPEQWMTLAEGQNRIHGLPIHVCDQGNTIAEVIANIATVVRRHGVRFVVLDWVQLIRAADTRQSDTSQLDEVLKRLKDQTHRLQIHEQWVAQLNRDKLRRRPSMNDFRGSAWFEALAGYIYYVWQDPEQMGEHRRDAEIGMLKNRFGTCPTLTGYFHGPTQQFLNMEVAERTSGGASSARV